ncbi:hypothetical protein JCM19235_1369 [Vibrio maritimus]|uniref:Uncharacterized protein n=1 Tax=Vibrio maritimus TaxID=990268 RepID=A0A090S8F4_9VIBR|nr:hypothetical protein JCM19235_1369 [Vibrio maritimus]
MASALKLNIKKLLITGFNAQGDIVATRFISVNLLHDKCPIEREQVGRAVGALLADEGCVETLVTLGKRHCAEFSCPKKAQKWAARELFDTEPVS